MSGFLWYNCFAIQRGYLHGREEVIMGGIEKKSRVLEIFYRAFRGEAISPKKLAQEHECSQKSIARDIAEINDFLTTSNELVGRAELKYSYGQRAYVLKTDDLLVSQELVAVLKILLGSRALAKEELLEIVSKLKRFSTLHDRAMMDELIRKEMYHYNPVNRDCSSLTENLWQLTECIHEHRLISIQYVKMSREEVSRCVRPLAVIFSEYYFYLLAYDESQNDEPHYYRVDRIKKIVEHRKHYSMPEDKRFDEGELRKRIQYMFPGEKMKIRFEFSGPSVQAVLDRMPTARVVEVRGRVSVLEAEVYGDGIRMFLLSQGSWVKVLEPQWFVEVMREEIGRMWGRYEGNGEVD